MGTVRKAIEMVKHGGYDSFGNPLNITRQVWVDVPAPENPLPDGTPTFMRVADDAALAAAEARYSIMGENLPLAKDEVTKANDEYNMVLDRYSTNEATIEDVEEAKIIVTRCEARLAAIEKGLNPARRAVAVARTDAVNRGLASFQQGAKVLADKRKALLEQIKLIDESYSALRQSFRQSGNVAASFVPSALDSLADSGTGYEDCLRRYAYSGLETEAGPEVEPRNIILSWQTQR